jgi:hypothetical protein
MSNEWLRRHQDVLRELSNGFYTGSFISDPENSDHAMQIAASMMGVYGPIFKWHHIDVQGKHVEALINNLPEVQLNMMFFDSYGSEENLLSISHRVVGFFLTEHKGRLLDSGPIYVGGPNEITRFFAMSCRALEEGKSSTEVIRIAKQTYDRAPYPYPDALSRTLNQYQRNLGQV